MEGFGAANLHVLSRSTHREVERAVEALEIRPSDNMTLAGEETAQIAAVQLARRLYGSIEEYVRDMNSYVADAVNRRAQLVCFPALCGLLPASLLPQYGQLAARFQAARGAPPPDLREAAASLKGCWEFLYDAFSATMSLLAARHRVYVMAGTIPYFDEGFLRHRAFLYSDSGDMAGFQDKISQSPLEQELGCEPGCEIKLFDTPLGPLSILAGEDAAYYEITRAAKNLGARLLLHPTVFTGEYTPVDRALGLNLRVQENRVYGVQSVLVGDSGLGFALEGRAAVFAPDGMVQSTNGVLAQTSGRFQPEVLVTRLNLAKLDLLRSPYTDDRNPELMKNYIDHLF